METSGTRPRPLSERNEFLQFELQLHQWLNSPGVTSRSWWHGSRRVTQAEGWPVFAKMKKSQKKDVCSKTKPGCQVDVNIFKYYIYLIYYIIYVTIREISHRYEFYEIDDNMIFGYVWASLVGVFPAIWRLINVKTKTCTSTSSLVVHTADGWEIRHPPVEVGSCSMFFPLFTRFYTSQVPGGCLGFFPSTVVQFFSRSVIFWW